MRVMGALLADRAIEAKQGSVLFAVLQRTSGVLPTGSGNSHGRCPSSGSGCTAGRAHQSDGSDCSQAPGRVVQVCTCKARHPELEQPAVLPGGFPARLVGCSCVTHLQPGALHKCTFACHDSWTKFPMWPGGAGLLHRLLSGSSTAWL